MVLIEKFFSENNLNILTTEEIFEGQRFAILAMFFALHMIDLFQTLKLLPERWV